MDVLVTPGVLVGLLVGIPTGMAVQHVRHAVKSYTTAKNAVPGLKETASSAETRGALWLLVAGALVLLVLVVLVRTTGS